ncbi:GtrA family protein [Succinimonas amylolytica]|uniref:GtrA family protein n=1 Tax=Succinimonas amylolytica TaxID=83769 RepID=UPI0023A8F5CB
MFFQLSESSSFGVAEFFRIVRFVMVGGLATLTDLAVSFLLVSVAGSEATAGCLSLLGFSEAAVVRHFEEFVTVLAFLAAFGVSYYGHTVVTFHAARSSAILLKMLLVSLAAMLLRVVFVYVIKLVWGWGESGVPVYEINYGLLEISFSASYIPLLTSMVLVTAMSYLLFKHWVFRS